MNIGNVKVGDKFSTETKLVRALGLEPQTGKKNKEYQIREIKRYLSYEKTGKINIKTHKVSNEIIITEIYDEPLDKIDKGRPSIYKDLLMNCFRTIQSGQYTRSELMKHCGLIEDCSVVSTYVTEEMANMTKEKLKSHRDKSNYLNHFKKAFGGHVKTAFGNLKNEGFDCNYTYLIKKHKEDFRNDFVLASKTQDNIIRETEERCKKEIEHKYNEKFNSIKFMPNLYKEYLENVDKELFKKLGIYGYCPCYDIYQSESILNKYKTPENVLHIVSKVKPDLKELYRSKMKEYVETYESKRTPKENKIKSAKFGRRESNIVREPFTLKNSIAVKLLHEKIFGKN